MYLVTGATGNVGSKIAEELVNQGEKVRLFLRDAKKAEPWNTRVDIAVGDFIKPETFRPALEGIRAIFLMNRGPDQKSFEEFVSAARDLGVQKIVFLSTLAAADPGLTIGKMHKDQEDTIRASGLVAKMLRPGGFMSNTFGWIGSIKAEGKVYNAMGPGRFAPVAPEDIAAAGVRPLTDDLPEEVFNISGDEPTTVGEQVSNHPEDAIRLYEQNTLLSESLYGILQGLEIALRNPVHEQLASVTGSETWWALLPLAPDQLAMIHKAKDALHRERKPLEAGRIVAELSFGFWTSLFGPRYSALWNNHLVKAFPRRPLQRSEVQVRLNSVRKLRNRVAHHEPIRCATKEMYAKAHTVSKRKRATRKASPWSGCLDFSVV